MHCPQEHKLFILWTPISLQIKKFNLILSFIFNPNLEFNVPHSPPFHITYLKPSNGSKSSNHRNIIKTIRIVWVDIWVFILQVPCEPIRKLCFSIKQNWIKQITIAHKLFLILQVAPVFSNWKPCCFNTGEFGLNCNFISWSSQG
jgi:hypothetical protein